MTEDLLGPNEVAIAGRPHLLAGLGKVHLVREVGAGAVGQPALPDDMVELAGDWPTEWASAYDRDAVCAPRWSHRTVCGRPWYYQSPGEGPGVCDWDGSAHVPTCGACLRIVARGLATTDVDPRIPFIVDIAMRQLWSTGGSMIRDVPGDQVEHLRSALRVGLRERGLHGRTLLVEGTVHVWSDEVWLALGDERRSELDRQLAATVDAALRGTPSNDPEPELERAWVGWNEA